MDHDPTHPDHMEEAVAEQVDNVVPSFGYQTLPVVGLGGPREPSRR